MRPDDSWPGIWLNLSGVKARWSLILLGAAALAVTGMPAGCGEDEATGDPEPGDEKADVSLSAAAASSLIDLHIRAISALETFAGANDDAVREGATKRVSGLADEAKRIARETSGSEGPSLAAAAQCMEGALRDLAVVMAGEPGTEAQSDAKAGVRTLAECLEDLKEIVSGFGPDEGGDASSARIDGLAPDASLIAALQEVLAPDVIAPPVVTETPEAPVPATPEATTVPETDTTPGESADLPECGPGVPEPCR